MWLKKLSLISILFMFMHGGTFSQAYTPDAISSPDCSQVVYVDNVFSDFFKNFMWVNRKTVSTSLSEQFLYWIIFQEELTQAYGYLENPPAELILRNQLCNHLGKKNAKTVSMTDPDLIKWVNSYGKSIVDQIHQQSVDVRNSLISKQKQVRLSTKEQAVMQNHLKQIQTRVRKDYF